jgi:hypothetical protein
MAGFEKGKTKNRRLWDAAVYGNVLSVREWATNDDRLRGYRAMSSPKAAQAEMSRLAAQKIDEGFVPTDDAGRKLAASLPASTPAKPKRAGFPVRQDLYVYNEGTGFIATSGRLAGKGYDNGGKKWEKAVAAGDLFPVSLIQDDSFLIRVVVGDDLTAQEEEEWVGRIDSRLKVPDGNLVISAVAEYIEEGYEEDEADEFVRTLDIPKGHYDATMYAHLPGINGSSCLDELEGGYGRMEKIGAWMRRTRPGVPFPPWIRRWCIGDEGADPGHEAEWKGLEYPDQESEPEYIGFLLHLRPPEPPAKATPPEGLQSGWFGETAGARKPARCPLGLTAENVMGRTKEEKGEFQYAQDITAATEPLPLTALAAPVEAALDRLGEVFGLAWLAQPHTLPDLRATLPKGSEYEFSAAWPEGLVVFRDGEVLRALSTSGSGAQSRRALEVLGSLLRDLPDGTRLELRTAPIEGTPKKGDGGLQRYRGTVKGGVWKIEETHPAVPADRLGDAIALAAELNAQDTLAVTDEAEAKAILKWLRANHGPYVIEDNPPRFKEGCIQLKKPERGLLWLVGSAAFAVRFRDVFPVMDLSDGDEDDADQDDGDSEVPYEGRASKPIQGAKLLEGTSGRVYFNSMALMVSEKLAAVIQKRERELLGLKFRHVGDLVCSVFPNVVVRAYAQSDGDTWATYLVGAPDVVRFELSTRFEKGLASLATLEGPGADEPAKASFRQSMPGATAVQMLEAHNLRKNQLAAEFGAPLKLTPTVRGLAESVEAALAKQGA